MARRRERTTALVVVFASASIVVSAALWLRPRAASREELDAATAALIAADPGSSRALLAMAKSPRIVAAGSEVFRRSCAACHGASGSGIIAPNLTDRYWIHSPDPASILKLVRDGIPAKGMPAWEPILGFERARDATVFVLTLKGRNLPGKAPQGEILE
jgi:cytochrome c oxidase cbb3-type subunit 3